MQAETINVRPVPKAGIADIAAYMPGKNAGAAGGRVYKLSSNETPLGASPAAVEAYRQVAGNLALYPDGTAQHLREAIAGVFALPADRIMMGNGSDELLGLLAQTYLAPGDEAVVTEHGFTVYSIQIRAAGATVVTVKEKDCRVDVDAVLAAVTPRTRMVFITNPGNPTGTYLKRDEIRRLATGLPKHVLLVLDSAYAEYVPAEDYDCGLQLALATGNVVMTRTFSKVYGLAALRVGWMVAPAHVLDAVNRVRGPFNVNQAAQAAAAAAIADTDFIAEAVVFNARWRDWLTRELTALGLKVTPSVTNFLLVHFPPGSGKTATEADHYLQSRGYILRGVAGYGFPDALRLSIGSEEANRGVVAALKELLQENV